MTVAAVLRMDASSQNQMSGDSPAKAKDAKDEEPFYDFSKEKGKRSVALPAVYLWGCPARKGHWVSLCDASHDPLRPAVLSDVVPSFGSAHAADRTLPFESSTAPSAAMKKSESPPHDPGPCHFAVHVWVVAGHAPRETHDLLSFPQPMATAFLHQHPCSANLPAWVLPCSTCASTLCDPNRPHVSSLAGCIIARHLSTLSQPPPLQSRTPCTGRTP